MSPEERPPRVGRRTIGRFALAALAIVVMTAGATATAGLLEVKNITDELKAGGKAIDVAVAEAPPGKPRTILIIGSDRRYADRGDPRNARSDTIILLRLNSKAAATTIMSIPRDLKVEVRPGVEDKINAAYAQGGPAKTAAVVKRVLSSPERPFEINHVVNVNFGGFRDAVDQLGCVYADIDRDYFNDNNPPVQSSTDYAVIDINPGYQRLCGQDALDYVRYRHLDTDLVRSARQQDFLRQAKAQYGTSKLVDNRGELVRIISKYTQTDRALRTTKGLLGILELAIFAGAQQPLQQIQFPGILTDDGTYVEVKQGPLQRAVTQFLEGNGPPKAAKRKRAKKKRKPGTEGLIVGEDTGVAQVAAIADQVPFPVVYPRLVTSGVSYEAPRAYRLRDLRRKVHRAYRLVLDYGGGALGEFYGVQGTNWMNPPILKDPSESRTINGKKLDLYFDGRKLRLVAWRTPKAVYWVSNTLTKKIPNRQMLAIAGSLTRAG